MDAESAAAIDFAAAAYREDGVWTVSTLPATAATELDGLVHTLARLPSEVGTLGLVSVDDDFFVVARVSGRHVRLLLSDVGAATESPLARAVVERLDLPLPDDDDDQVQPAGDLGIVADLGLTASQLGALCDAGDLYPDELLGDIATRLGFGQQFDDMLDTALA
ncbi:MAG: tRNA adenosine deaminase-associated protein [Propionibacteriales bacterium]|nr:tRNA adenosine deaminase-associated protein [Propionibacteriales bacterium]